MKRTFPPSYGGFPRTPSEGGLAFSIGVFPMSPIEADGQALQEAGLPTANEDLHQSRGVRVGNLIGLLDVVSEIRRLSRWTCGFKAWRS